MTDNELIAEFMGGQRSQRGQDTVFYFTPDFRGSGFWHIDYIPFDRSWDWLMPVVEKIESLGPYKFDIMHGPNAHIFDWRNEVVLSFTGGDSKIESVYKAVVEFIKWYNSNHPQP